MASLSISPRSWSRFAISEISRFVQNSISSSSYSERAPVGVQPAMLWPRWRVVGELIY
jgi:hypothetical protein